MRSWPEVGPAGPEARGGFVLAVTVLLLIALGLVAHGALILARSQRVVASVSWSLLQAEGQAQLGEARLLTGGGRPDEGAGGVMAEGRSEAGRYRVTARPLDREWWWVASEGTAADGRTAVVREGPLWILDPLTRVAEAGGVVSVASGAPRGGIERIDAAPFLLLPTGPDARACRTIAGALAALGAARPQPLVEAEALARQEPGLGLIPFGTLLTDLPGLAAERVTPGPSDDGVVCVDRPWNWGEPGGRTGAPCRDRRVLRARSGDLTMAGGVGQGVLVVGGDLRLTEAARFRGLVLVAGRLRVDRSAVLEGMAQAVGGIQLDSSGRVEGSACAALRALDGLAGHRRGLDRVVPGPFWRW